MRLCVLALAAFVLSPGQAFGEQQMKLFLGVTLGGTTTFLDLDDATGRPHLAVGASVIWLGEMIGVEAELARAPGFFERGGRTLVARSSVVTLTGNVVVALPRRMTEYTLRPYIAGGVGLMRVRVDDVLGVFRVTSNLPAIDVGGGVTGLLTERVGVGWDVRHFRSIGGRDEGRGLTFGNPRLSFWRANMALTVRY